MKSLDSDQVTSEVYCPFNAIISVNDNYGSMHSSSITMPSETVFKVAAIPGDGIGVDITEAAKEVLNKLAQSDGTFSFDFTTFDWSSKAYLERGWYMPVDAIATLKEHDAIYFGAVGWPSVPDHISLWNMILPIRKELNQYVNVRPTRILPGTKSPLVECQKDPKQLDWIIVRENSEGEYAGQGGTTHGHENYAVATELAIFSYVGIERIMRFAFETAKQRPRKKLTMVTKSNAQRHGMVLWDKVFYSVAKEYEGMVEFDKMLVDAMTVRMVNRPESLDVIVATNCKSFHRVNHEGLSANFSISLNQCMQTFSQTWLPRLRARSVLHRLQTSTLAEDILVCSSQSTAQRQISPAKVLQTPWVLSGLLQRWCVGWAPGSSTPRQTR